MTDISTLEDFRYTYFDLCNNIAQFIEKSKYQLDEPEAKNFIQKFFNRFRKKKLKISDVLYNDYDELLVMYRSIIIKYNTINKRWEFPNLLIEFIYFIKIIEKCFFYVNDDNSKVYAEYNEIDKKYRLTIFCDDYNIIYDIQESDINMPGKVSNNDNNPLSFLIDKGEEYANGKSNNVFFVNLTIKRLYGESMKNEYKFISGSPIPLEDKSDDFMLYRVFNISKQIVFETMIDIFNNTICKMSKLEGKINVKEVFENGTVDVWRSRSK